MRGHDDQPGTQESYPIPKNILQHTHHDHTMFPNQKCDKSPTGIPGEPAEYSRWAIFRRDSYTFLGYMGFSINAVPLYSWMIYEKCYENGWWLGVAL